jgi:hypothetical protein
VYEQLPESELPGPPLPPSVIVQRAVFASLTVTVPVGLPSPVVDGTVAVKVTGCPTTGVVVDGDSVVVVSTLDEGWSVSTRTFR